MIEEWRDIPGFESIYQVSNLGRVKSLDRIDPLNHFRKGHIKNLSYDADGYLMAGFSKNGVKSSPKVHKLVAITFIGPRPEGLVIDHIDNNKTNNRIDNLRYVSQRENTTKDLKPGTSKFVGVTRSGSNWIARIKVNGKSVNLGSFTNEEDASKAYQKAKLAITQGQVINVKKPTYSSQYRGVSSQGKKWRASIKIHGKTKHLGTFNTEEEAHQAYLEAKKECNELGN